MRLFRDKFQLDQRGNYLTLRTINKSLFIFTEGENKFAYLLN
jgi:hypothetical protein